MYDRRTPVSVQQCLLPASGLASRRDGGARADARGEGRCRCIARKIQSQLNQLQQLETAISSTQDAL
eukprot:3932918-Rhodomonas_salina.1